MQDGKLCGEATIVASYNVDKEEMSHCHPRFGVM
jgi:hypothetical protein